MQSPQKRTWQQTSMGTTHRLRKCLERFANAWHKCLTYLDLDATEAKGTDQYRMATNKITDWTINE